MENLKKAKNSRVRLFLHALIIAAALEGSLFAQASVSTFFDTVEKGPVGIIVTYKDAVSENHLTRMNSRGAKLNRKFGFINSGAFIVDSSMIDAIAADPEVESIS